METGSSISTLYEGMRAALSNKEVSSTEKKKEQQKVINKRYYEKHKERLRKTKRESRRQQYQDDPEFRQKCIDSAIKWNRVHRDKKGDENEATT